LGEVNTNRVPSATLDDFVEAPERKISERIERTPPPEPAASSLEQGYLISVGYDGSRYSAFVKLYDPRTHNVHVWYDSTGHRPYCLAKEPVEELRMNRQLLEHPGLAGFQTVEKYDALRERRIQVTKVIARDPLSIGGKPGGTIRDAIKAWEADIKYVENFIYDLGLHPGMPYKIYEGSLLEVDYSVPKDIIEKVLGLLSGESREYIDLAVGWLKLLECPFPDFRRAALDIEVASPKATRVPDPQLAEDEVICAAIVGNDGRRSVLVLEREGVDEGATPMPEGVSLDRVKGEKDLLAAIFEKLRDYPVIVTFNGDDFDLKYLYHRAQRLGFSRDEIPIEMGRDAANLSYGIHIDLYRFFFNRSIQIYAFGQRYREVTLGEISEALLEAGKMEISAPVSDLSYSELAAYCYQDAELTLRLTTFDDNLLMKLIVAISRISYMSLEDVPRQGVSGWIRSLIYNEHRRRAYLIPRPDEILELKGTTTTEAIIKGKKYKGAIVVEPIPGVHFNVAVVDFMSMYPSVIKQWNLGYETILCSHPECRVKRVPDTPHWVCKRNRSLESLVIGSLRDLRVRWYKNRAKEKSVQPELRSWYKVVSDALKVFLNASYGVFGTDKFALYCPPVAEATAAIGRYIITKTIEKARELGIEVFYGDTDSIFLGSPSQQQLQELIEWSKRTLGMELEVDKNYRYLALSSRKKNYLGVHPDGRVDIKGLTGKKRHIPEFIHRAFYQMVDILSKVESREEFEQAKGKIKETVRDLYVKLKNRDYELSDLAFTVMLGKEPERYTKTEPQHVKAARLLAQKGVDIRAGDLIAFVKVREGVKPVQLASKEEVDIAKYMEYIGSTFEQVLDALGMELTELTGATRLESFFTTPGHV